MVNETHPPARSAAETTDSRPPPNFLQLGALVLVEGRVGRYIGAASLSSIQVRYEDNAEVDYVDHSRISPFCTTPQVPQRAGKPSRDVGPEAWEQAIAQATILEPYLHREITAEEAQDLANRLTCSRSKVWRLLAKFRADPSPLTLVGEKPGRKKGSCTATPAVAALVRSKFNELAASRKSFRVSELLRVLEPCFRTLGLRVGRKAVLGMIGNFPPEIQMQMRLGKHLARERHRLVKASLEATGVLDIMQADFTIADLFIVDPEHGNAIGRPWLGLTIDVYSRAITGFVLFLEAPSSLTSGWLISTAVTPKVALMKELGIDREWECYGMPKTVHVDNGFRTAAFQYGCEQNDINIYFRPPATPRYGGHIERLIGTMMGQLRLIPGSTLADPMKLRKMKVQPAEQACLTLLQARQYIANEIYQYNHRLHRVIGEAPIDRWRRSLSGINGPLIPIPPPDARTFAIRFLWNKECLVTKEGVQHGLTYRGPELAGLVGTKIRMHFNHSRLSPAYVLIDGKYVEIHATNSALGSISLWEYKAAKKLAGVSTNRISHEVELARAARANKLLIDAAVSRKNLRLKARRNDQSRLALTVQIPPKPLLDPTVPLQLSQATWEED